MKSFSVRLRAYLKKNNLSQYRFAKNISLETKHKFKCTLSNIQRWANHHKPRASSYESALVMKIVQDWEKSKGIHHLPSGGKTQNPSANGRNVMLNKKWKGLETLSFFERREIVDTFCNSGHSLSSVLTPRQEKIIRWHFGLNKSKKSLNMTAIARKLRVTGPTVRSIIFTSLRRLTYPHLPVGIGLQCKSFQNKKKVLDDYFKTGRSLSDVLDKKETAIIQLRYGLDGRKSSTLQAIGNQYGVTREAVRMTILRSLQKLEKSLR